MVARAYVPDSGDLIWIDFDPQAGREQAGRRPALVLSPAVYNGKSSLALVCPITSQIKGYPFELLLPKGLKISGVVLCDHIKNVDWNARRAQRAGRVSDGFLNDVRQYLAPLLGFR